MEALVQDLQQQLQEQQERIAEQAAQMAALVLQVQQQAAQLQIPVPQQVQVPRPFALTPAQAHQDVIDLSTTAGIKLHRGIVTPLMTKFDGAENRLTSFLNAVTDRAIAANWWNTLLRISNQAPVNPRVLHLITQHRMLSLQNIRAHAATYVGQHTRRAQDASFMYEFLRDSLTEGARTRLALQARHFVIQDFYDGPSYLKVILLTFYVETRATDFHLREKIHALPKKMFELDYDILSFNTHVRETIDQLASGGGESSDLLLCIFKAYAIVPDSDFRRFIQRKRDDYDDGELITVESLMAEAQTKFAQLKQSNKWKAKTHREEAIVVLAAQLRETTEQIKKLTTESTTVSDSEDS